MGERIAVIGNITRDTLYFVDQLPAIDNVATVRRFVNCFGGRGAVTATALSPAFQTSLITTVPVDELQGVSSFLRTANDKLDGVEASDGLAALSQVLISIGKVEQNCTSLFLPGGESELVSTSQGKVIAGADIVYLTTHGRKFNKAAVEYVAKDALVACNITDYMFADAEYRACVFDRANILIGNESEWAALLVRLGLQNPSDVFSLCPYGRQVFRTLGSQGAEAFDASGPHIRLEPSGATQVVAPVGVGDAFAAGILASAVIDDGMERAIHRGMRLAELCLESTESSIDSRIIRSYFSTDVGD